jgi:hypothetical protein
MEATYSSETSVDFQLCNHCVNLIFYVFLTTALDGNEWSASRPGRFTPGIEPPVHFEWEAGWVSQPS